MANQEEPIRIVIEEEDLPLIPDKPGLKAPDVKAGAKQVSDKATELAQKAWDSEPRRKVTDGAAALVKLLSADANAQIKVADAYTTPAGHSGAARFERIPHGPWPGWDVKRRVAEYLGCNVDIVPDHKASQLAATPAEGLL